jgi:hypothetical protein
MICQPKKSGAYLCTLHQYARPSGWNDRQRITSRSIVRPMTSPEALMANLMS